MANPDEWTPEQRQRIVNRAHTRALRQKRFFEEEYTPKDRRPGQGGFTKAEKRRLKPGDVVSQA